MAVTTEQKELMTAPVRQNIKPYLELKNSDTSPTWHNLTIPTENIKSLTLERVGDETKFFGYGIVQKINVKLMGYDEEFKQTYLTTDTYFYVKFNTSAEDAHYFAHSPAFFVSEVHTNENTGEMSVTAYDMLYKASTHTPQELDDNNYYYDEWNDKAYLNFTIDTMANNIAEFLGFSSAEIPVRKIFDENTTYKFPTFTWNLDGTEPLRDILDDIAEVYHGIYYATVDANGNNILKFRQFKGKIYSDNFEGDLTVTKDDYFTLKTQYYRSLGQLTHSTVLGDDVTADGEVGEQGTHIFIRDNSILSLMSSYEIGKYLRTINYSSSDYGDDTIPNLEVDLKGFSLGQFEMNWRGNPWLEIGDIIKIQKKEEYSDVWGSYEYVFGTVLNDVIEYDGTLKQKTQWNYKIQDEGLSGNPATLGEALKYTSATVDKVNQNITQVVQTQDEHGEQISTLVTEAGNISASVTTIQNGLEETMEGINGQFDTLTKKVEAAVTEDDVKITIEKELSNGVDKVTTSTGFVLDEEGLNISKNTSEMATTITEDGMRVYRSGEEVLTANNEGVKAEDLHATTYLIIGNNSRFEDMGSNRTACFWIGGE